MNATSSIPPQRRVQWLHVVVFYALACAVSWLFFWWRDIHPESWAAWGAPGFLKNWSYMWGPGIAAIVCLIGFRRPHRSTITFRGTSASRSVLFYTVPILLLCIPGLNNKEGVNPHLFPLMAGVFGFIAILGEELGWRGFLQDALRPLHPAWRYVIIAVLWEAWHFTNRMHDTPPLQAAMRVAVFALVGIGLSAIIGQATDRSRSVVVAVTLHAWVDIAAEFGRPAVWVVAGASLLFWAWMLWKWPVPQPVVVLSEPPGSPPSSL